jgi:DNA-directed RNA polymerase specialized sigma subunit
LTSLDNELRTVKMSNYAQKKANEAGEPVFNSVRIDISITQNDDERKPREIKYGMFENEKFSNGDVYQYLYHRLDSEFPLRDCNMFYMAFGLKDFEETKGKDIAKEFGISEGLVSQKLKKIISFIRKDNDICEMLQNLI